MKFGRICIPKEKYFNKAYIVLFLKTSMITKTVNHMNFKVWIEKDEDGFYIATVPSLPGCVSQGTTEEEAKTNIKEAISLHLSSLALEGIPITTNSGIKETLVAVDL